MKKKLNLNLNPRTLLARLKKFLPILTKHATFITLMIILISYLFVVFRISQLARAEPSVTDETIISAIPKVDKNAIDQIQALEQSNAQVHSLFDSARKNPFQE